MQVARRTVAATAAVMLGLVAALAIIALRLRDVRRDHDELIEQRRHVCASRVSRLRSLMLSYDARDTRNRDAEKEFMLDPYVSDLCLGVAYPIDADRAEWCWIITADERKGAHCYDAVFDGLWLLYRFRFGPGY